MKVNIIQGTKDWHDLRAKKWTASNSPVVLNCSKFKSKKQLAQEIRDGSYAQIDSPPIYHGSFLEPFVREMINHTLGVKFEPEVHISDLDKRFLASLDGVYGEIALEIKCPFSKKSEYMNLVKNGEVPLDLMIQVQHQLFCSTCRIAYVVVYLHNEMIIKGKNDGEKPNIDPDNLFIIEVERDESLIKKIIEAWEEFEFDFIEEAIELSTAVGAESQEEKEVQQVVELYLSAEKALQKAKEDLELYKNRLEEIVGNGQMTVGKYSIVIKNTPVKGAIDYSKVVSSLNIDINLDQFRKPDSFRKMIKVTPIM